MLHARPALAMQYAMRTSWMSLWVLPVQRGSCPAPHLHVLRQLSHRCVYAAPVCLVCSHPCPLARRERAGLGGARRSVRRCGFDPGIAVCHERDDTMASRRRKGPDEPGVRASGKRAW
jgi:hypothetical protein